MITCASIMAYIGDCSRFYSAKQLRNYVGLVPMLTTTNFNQKKYQLF